MKVAVAIDSFKGSLSTFEAGAAVKEGILAAYGDAEVDIYPLADGGEGTVDALSAAMGGKRVTVNVTGPLGDPVDAVYGVIRDRRLAVIEMASAAGITLVPEEKRDPLVTTTYGVGEIIAHAIRTYGCREFIIGIGGSATNDGGIGMLSALGFEFLDIGGEPVTRGALGVSEIESIVTDGAMPQLRECVFHIACDVKNPLCGELGCSAIYGPQKGACPADVIKMDGWLSRYASLTAQLLGKDNSTYPGAGAAGGLGFAFISYLDGILEPGIELVIKATGLEEKLAEADVAVTGEGRLDAQSAMGKAPVGVARAAKKYGKPVIAFSGCIGHGAEACNENGIDAFFPIVRTPLTLAEAMDHARAYENLKCTAEQAFRLIKAF